MSRDVLVVDAVIKLMYNVPHRKVFEAVYGTDHVESYAQEKMKAMSNLPHWWGMLDEEHQQRLVDVALQRQEIR